MCYKDGSLGTRIRHLTNRITSCPGSASRPKVLTSCMTMFTLSKMDPDFLILADRAEAVNGKLYMVGGGWDRVAIADTPGPADFDVAAGVLVGYNETNQAHHLALILENDDNQTVLGPIAAQFELGRPPGMKQGQSQRFQLVIRGPFPIPKPGAYNWVLVLNGERRKTTAFWADKASLPTMNPPPTAGR